MLSSFKEISLELLKYPEFIKYDENYEILILLIPKEIAKYTFIQYKNKYEMFYIYVKKHFIYNIAFPNIITDPDDYHLFWGKCKIRFKNVEDIHNYVMNIRDTINNNLKKHKQKLINDRISNMENDFDE